MKVKPVKLEKVRLMDVELGETFTFNGLKYIKLAEDSIVYAVPALSISSVATVNISQNLGISVEKKVVDAYFKAMKTHMCANLVETALPDADIFRKYNAIINKEISDCWYVDNGTDDLLCGDEFMFVDNLKNLRTGSPSNAITQQITDGKLNVRILGYIEPFAEVLVSIK